MGRFLLHYQYRCRFNLMKKIHIRPNGIGGVVFTCIDFLPDCNPALYIVFPIFAR
jgi:hypothetical protein